MRTFHEVLEQLKQLDPDVLLELLDVSSEDLVERFQDLIEDRMEGLSYDLNQWFEESSEED